MTYNTSEVEKLCVVHILDPSRYFISLVNWGQIFSSICMGNFSFLKSPSSSDWPHLTLF